MKINLKKIIFLAFIFATFTSYSQDCEVKNDPITGEKTCIFNYKNGSLKYEYKVGGVINFLLTFDYSGEQNFAMPKGSEVIIKLENDSIIRLYSIVEAMPQTKVFATQNSAGVMTYYTFAFELTADQIKTLASSNVVFYRYPSVSGGTNDYEVKGLGKIFAKKITKGAQCILENL